jgi:AcrR family transcriptional regulator
VTSGRERILRAAVEVLASGGIDDLRIARVARLADVSPALVHYHFQSREALLAEALERSYEVAADSRAAAPDPRAPVFEQLVAKLDASLPVPGGQQHEWELWVELWLRALRDPGLRSTTAQVYGRLHATMRSLIAEGVRRGEFEAADPDAAADRLLGLIAGLGVRALLGDPAMPVERARERVLAALERELGVSAADRAR